MIQVTATTRSGLIPERSARSSLSEKARIDLPVRVRLRNQKRSATATAAVTSVMACEVRMARPSARPVASRKVRASMTKRAPSAKVSSSTPMMKRTMPFITNITPIETMTSVAGAARTRR